MSMAASQVIRFGETLSSVLNHTFGPRGRRLYLSTNCKSYGWGEPHTWFSPRQFHTLRLKSVGEIKTSAGGGGRSGSDPSLTHTRGSAAWIKPLDEHQCGDPFDSIPPECHARFCSRM